jgi:hypothetical protein
MVLSKGIVACVVVSVVFGTVFVVTGCNKASSSTVAENASKSKSTAVASTTDGEQSVKPHPQPAGSNLNNAEAIVEGEHPHKPGSHGGIIIPIGSDSYHAEAVIEKGGNFRLMTLGKDESRIQEVDIQTIKAYVKIVGQPDATLVELSALPQEGDTSEKTSQFVGQLPDEARGKPLEVTIPNIRINGERFRIGFTTASLSHQKEIPAPLPPAEEQALYFTPAGKYTEADIEANGRMTASQKFKGVLSSHDMKPKPGDRICPVTLTKANPKFTWTVGGKPYEFCCPPCVDEFVKLAKEQPDEIKSPDTYIK